MRWRFLFVVILAAGVGVTVQPQEEYSIWMAPSGAEYDLLHQLICELAEQYPSHCFMPHMTVVPNIEGPLEEIGRLAEELAGRTAPLQANIPGIEWATPDEYYRAFYLLIEESAEFSRLYEDTCDVVGKCHRRPYHISLMYTDSLSPEERGRVRDRLYAEGRVPSTLLLDRLQVCTLKDPLPEKWTCPVEIHLGLPAEAEGP